MNKFKKTTLAENILESNMKRVYCFNEDVDPYTYRKLTKEERQSVLAEYLLVEYVNTSKIIDAVFYNRNKADTVFAKVEHDLRNNAYFRDIERSAGDITKTAHYKNVKDLLTHIDMVNGTNNSTIPADPKVVEYVGVLQTAIHYFETNTAKLKAIINREASRQNNRKLAMTFYKVSVFMIQTTADMLYSQSFEASFNYNMKPPVVENVHFQLKNDNISEQIAYISQLNQSFSSGKIFKAFDNLLLEEVEGAMERLETLNENVLDTIFGIVTHFKTLDLLILWPVYIIRAIVYWIGYGYETFKNISNSIERSIAIRKNSNVTEEEFRTYKSESSKHNDRASQAFAKADVAITLTAKDDVNALNNLQKTNNTGLMI